MTHPHNPTQFRAPVPTNSLLAINPPAHPSFLTLGEKIAKACQAWLMKSPSPDTRSNYERDIKQFLA
jgi:hypothetical protein